jgi:hypothetical protein
MRRHESNLPFGGPAFPFVFDDGRQRNVYTGMTLRDYFAAKAMQAFIGNANLNVFDVAAVARGAYKMADAMLKAREE